MRTIIIIGLCLICLTLWWTTPHMIQPGSGRVATEAEKAAIFNMGPGFAYRMIGDRLEVDQGRGWERLKYYRRMNND